MNSSVLLLSLVFCLPPDHAERHNAALTGETIREALESMVPWVEGRRRGWVSLVWSEDENTIYYLQNEDYRTYHLTALDLLTGKRRIVVEDFDSGRLPIGLSADAQWIVAWRERRVTIAHLPSGRLKRIDGRFSHDASLGPSGNNLIIWAKSTSSASREPLLVRIPFSLSDVPVDVLHSPTLPPSKNWVYSAEVEVCCLGEFLVWSHLVRADDDHWQSVTSVGVLKGTEVKSIVNPWEEPASPYVRRLWCGGSRRLLAVRDEGRLEKSVHTCDLGTAVADGRIAEEEWIPLYERHALSQIEFGADPRGEYLAYAVAGMQRRQRTATGLLAIDQPDKYAGVDGGWDMAAVFWSPRGSYVVSVVGASSRSGPSIKVLTRSDVRRLLESVDREDGPARPGSTLARPSGE